MKSVFLFALLLTAMSGTSRADEWPAPGLQLVFSPDRGALLRIVPSDGFGQLATAAVLLLDPSSGDYRQVAKFSLRNRVAPYSAVVTNNADFVVTLDDWGEVGRGENVIVVYKRTGEVIRTWSLADIFSEEEIRTFRWTVSSTWWRGDVEVSEVAGSPPDVLIKPDLENPPHRSGRTPGFPFILHLGNMTVRK